MCTGKEMNTSTYNHIDLNILQAIPSPILGVWR